MTARIEQPYLLLHVRLCGTLPYDKSFFATQQPYQAMIVTSPREDQPHYRLRSLFKQALPIFVNPTTGLQQRVDEGQTGYLFEPGIALDLKRTLERVAARTELLATRAAACVERAWKSTHAWMGEARRQLIIEAFSAMERVHQTEFAS